MSLDDTVQDLADRLGTPLVVLDLDLKVAAYSMHDTPERRDRLARLLAGSQEPVTATLVRQHRLQAATAAVRIPADRQNGPRLVMPLRHQKQLFGYLYLVEDRPGIDIESDQGTAHLVEASGPEIGTLLALRLSDLRNTADRSRRLLAALVSESPTERQSAADALLRDGLIESTDHYSVLVYRSPDSSLAAATGLAVDATLDFTTRSTTVKIVGAVVGNEGIVLFPRPVNRTRLEKSLHRPGLEKVRAGVGSAKDSLTDAVESYREATIACRASALDPDRYGQRAFWEDLGLDRVLLRLPLETLTPRDLPDGVRRLLASPNAAELTATMEGFLECGGEIQGTAKRLNIHRSTLYHRLDRIREVTGSDISDGSTRLELHAGLRIARLAGMAPRD
ncbi:PucR family transcriptional regulator [Rhodococcus sp. NPDC003318]|uniref:PucR family transcriptional regulator n=1 Tax=Rhodococcus sp. NPDC003318 TaxID=3364503 RepID=UPI0036A2F8F2